jgi:exosortase C (VPDSG-CTERM-specific)
MLSDQDHRSPVVKTPVPRTFASMPRSSQRMALCGLLVAALAAAFISPLCALFAHAAASEIHSHILLVPLISAYLVKLRWPAPPAPYRSGIIWGGVFALLGLLLFISNVRLAPALTWNDHLSLTTASFLSFLFAIGFAVLGRAWMSAFAFPLAFLIFLIPLPDQWVQTLETASKLASTEAANALFSLSSTPVLRQGTNFQLPGMVIHVAQECSGIRSSLVLFITSLVAANLFLRSPWRRLVLVACVIPLGIIRNGFRIVVIARLCIDYGPQMIHSWIHHQGGPFFFVLSLTPLLLLIWWLRAGERRPELPPPLPDRS